MAAKQSITKKYEYRRIHGTFPSQDALLAALNKAGAEGWRVLKLDMSVGTAAFMVAWLERELP